MQSAPIPGSFADKLQQAMQRRQESAKNEKRT
jgi:hypothetical protein